MPISSMMDRLCFRKPRTTNRNNNKKICMYQDEAKLKNQKKRRQSKGVGKPGFHLHHSADSTTVRDSMQYYRIWIYSCNMVLGLTSLIFIAFAAFVLADVRLSLLRGFEFYHPTFLYAYAALICQCGIIQVVGCFGAQRLSHKLLSIYWIFLLILTIGDVIVGLVWVFKLDEVKLALRPALTKQFLSKYSTDGQFTKIWNTVQAQEHCCGVDGPIDFDKFITSSMINDLENTMAHDGTDGSSGGNVFLAYATTTQAPTMNSLYLQLPDSCCMTISYPIPSSFPVPIQGRTALDPHLQEGPSIATISSSMSASSSSRTKRQSQSQPHLLSPHNVHYALNSSNNSEELIYSSRFVNTKHLNRHHEHRMRHFVHPRKNTLQQQQFNRSRTNHRKFQSVHDDDDDDDENDSANYIDPHLIPSSDPSANAYNNGQLTEVLIPFSCRNPFHNQIHQPQQHQRQASDPSGSNLPSQSFTKSFHKPPASKRSMIASTDDHHDNEDDDHDARNKDNDYHRPSVAFPVDSSARMTNDNQPNPANVVTDEAAEDTGTGPQSQSRDEDYDFANYRRNSKRHAPPSSATPSSPSLSGAQYKNKVRVYRNGCYVKLSQWLDHVAGILFIVGFCIIGFVKIAFVIILRYEIREMIEKIHLLETEGSADGAVLSNSPSRSGNMHMLQKQHSLQSNSYNLVQSTGSHFGTAAGITIKSPVELGTPFLNHNCATHHLYHHHHHLPPHFATQHRHSTTPYWGQTPHQHPALLHHRGSHCGSILGGGMGISIGGIGSGLTGCTGRRRPSGRSLNEMDMGTCLLNTAGTGVGDICCSNHSQETVNMTLLITTPTRRESAGGDGDLEEVIETAITSTELDGEGGGNENISLKVPMNSSASSANKNTNEVEAHLVRRNNFANHSCWDSNVSCDSSTSNVALDGSVGGGVRRDHSSSSSLQGFVGSGNSGTTQLVKVDMENHRGLGDGMDDALNNTNIQFIDEDLPAPGGATTTTSTNLFTNNPMITYDTEDNNGASASGGGSGATGSNNETVILNLEGDSSSANSPRHLHRQPHSIESSTGRLLAHANSGSSSSSGGPGLRRNGNNNSVDSGQSIDSDYIMSFIGTSV